MEQSPYFMPNVQIKQEPVDFNPASVYDLPVPPMEAPPPAKPKRSRKRKTENADNGDHGGQPPTKVKVKQEKLTDSMPVKKKRDRFNGMPEEEVIARGLPDLLSPNLDIVIVGINPGLMAAYVGHHYAGPGNHFWKCLYLSNLIPEPMTAYDDYKLTKFGIGFTNIVARTTKGSADLTRKEIKEGGEILSEKLKEYKPKIAVFNGKGIYEVFCGHKNFYIGKQPEPLAGTDIVVYVMPSSSARCSQLPRAIDKVPFYAALKKLRDYLRGDTETLEESDVCFPDLELKVKVKAEKLEENGGRPTKGKNKNNQLVPNGNFHNMPMKPDPGFDPACFGMMPHQLPHNAHPMGHPNSWHGQPFPPHNQHLNFSQQGQPMNHMAHIKQEPGQSHCTELMPMRIKQEPGQNFCSQSACSVISSEGNTYPNTTSPVLHQMANMAPPYPFSFDQLRPSAFSHAATNSTSTYPSSTQSCHGQNTNYPQFGQNSSIDGNFPGMPASLQAVPGPAGPHAVPAPQAPAPGFNHNQTPNEMGPNFMGQSSQSYHRPQGSPQSGIQQSNSPMYNTATPPQQSSPNNPGQSPGGKSPAHSFRPQQSSPESQNQQFNNMYNSNSGPSTTNAQSCPPANSQETLGHSPRSHSPRYIGSPPPQNYQQGTCTPPNSGMTTYQQL